MLKKVILTVQPNGSGGWRLGLGKEDSIKYFSHLESVQFDLKKELIVFCNAACGSSKKKAFDFNNKSLSKWIEDNSFCQYPKRKPTKLIFKLTTEKNKKRLKFETAMTNP